MFQQFFWYFLKMMKKAIASVFIGLSLSAHAAGLYDGIYQTSSGREEWISVQTKGTSAVVTHYFLVSTTGMVFETSLGKVTPTQGNNWDLLLGSINGNIVSVAGEMNYNSCAVEATGVFTENSVVLTINSSQNTFKGSSAGVNCGAIKGSQYLFKKIF